VKRDIKGLKLPDFSNQNSLGYAGLAVEGLLLWGAPDDWRRA
jgi:hypothetical protein